MSFRQKSLGWHGYSFRSYRVLNFANANADAMSRNFHGGGCSHFYAFIQMVWYANYYKHAQSQVITKWLPVNFSIFAAVAVWQILPPGVMRPQRRLDPSDGILPFQLSSVNFLVMWLAQVTDASFPHGVTSENGLDLDHSLKWTSKDMTSHGIQINTAGNKENIIHLYIYTH